MLYLNKGCTNEWIGREYIENYTCETCNEYNGTDYSFNEKDIDEILNAYHYAGWDSHYFLKELFSMTDYDKEMKEEIIKRVKEEEKVEE